MSDAVRVSRVWVTIKSVGCRFVDMPGRGIVLLRMGIGGVRLLRMRRGAVNLVLRRGVLLKKMFLVQNLMDIPVVSLKTLALGSYQSLACL